MPASLYNNKYSTTIVWYQQPLIFTTLHILQMSQQHWKKNFLPVHFLSSPEPKVTLSTLFATHVVVRVRRSKRPSWAANVDHTPLVCTIPLVGTQHPRIFPPHGWFTKPSLENNNVTCGEEKDDVIFCKIQSWTLQQTAHPDDHVNKRTS